MGIQAGAQTGQAATSLIREKLFIKKKNEETFAPKGLKVEVMKGKMLKGKLGLAPEAPLAASVDESIRMGLSVHDRRMAGIKHLIAPLMFDVPPPSESTGNYLDRMHAKMQTKKLQEQENKAKKYRERYSKAADEQEERIGRKTKGYTDELDRLQGKIHKQEQERQRRRGKVLNREMSSKRRARKLGEIEAEFDYEVKDIERRIRGLTKEHEEVMDEMSKDLREEDKEAQIGDKIYWVLVQNL